MAWTTKKDKRINRWLENAKVYAWLHSKSKQYYEGQFNRINIPIIIITSLLSVVTGIGSIIKEAQTGLLITACIVNAVITALSVSLSAYKPSKVSSSHETASKDYQKLVIDLEYITSLEFGDRPNSKEYLDSLAKQISSLKSNTPSIPRSVWVVLNKSIDDGTLYKEIDPSLIFMSSKIRLHSHANVRSRQDSDQESAPSSTHQKDSLDLDVVVSMNDTPIRGPIHTLSNEGIDGSKTDSDSDPDSDPDTDVFSEISKMGIVVSKTGSIERRQQYELERAMHTHSP